MERNKSPVLLYLLHCGNMYGTERMALATLENLHGYRRVVIAPPPRGDASVAVTARLAGYEAVTFRGRLGLLLALLPWFIKHRSIDVIGTGVVHSAACYILAKIFVVKLRQIHIAHGGTPTSFDQKRALNRIPVTVVAVSEFVKCELIRRGVRKDRITVIDNFLSDEQSRNGILRPKFDIAPPAGWPLNQTRIRVAVVSRVDPIKRVELLVQAIEKYGLNEFYFDIYGVGMQFDQLKNRTSSLANIHFHGYVSDVNVRLAKADVLLQLCPDEPFGLAVLEGFLARLIVVVPDAGGLSGLVEDGISGLHFVANDATDLTRALNQLRTCTSAAIQKLAEAGHATLSTRFSSVVGAQRYRDTLMYVDSQATT